MSDQISEKMARKLAKERFEAAITEILEGRE